uniref:Uncharacterized protein n=1 Tax=Anguilla anguilla TaxID=7936 RepID=A0A0E9XGC0_ANGAN
MVAEWIEVKEFGECLYFFFLNNSECKRFNSSTLLIVKQFF